MRWQLSSGADGHGSRELLRRDSLVRQGVHPHGDLEVVQVVEEEAKVFELVEGDPLQACAIDGPVLFWIKKSNVRINYIFTASKKYYSSSGILLTKAIMIMMT